MSDPVTELKTTEPEKKVEVLTTVEDKNSDLEKKDETKDEKKVKTNSEKEMDKKDDEVKDSKAEKEKKENETKEEKKIINEEKNENEKNDEKKNKKLDENENEEKFEVKENPEEKKTLLDPIPPATATLLPADDTLVTSTPATATPETTKTTTVSPASPTKTPKDSISNFSDAGSEKKTTSPVATPESKTLSPADPDSKQNPAEAKPDATVPLANSTPSDTKSAETTPEPASPTIPLDSNSSDVNSDEKITPPTDTPDMKLPPADSISNSKQGDVNSKPDAPIKTANLNNSKSLDTKKTELSKVTEEPKNTISDIKNSQPKESLPHKDESTNPSTLKLSSETSTKNQPTVKSSLDNLEKNMDKSSEAISSIKNEKDDSKSENITTPTSPNSKNKPESAKEDSSKKSPEQKEDSQNNKPEIASNSHLSSGEQTDQSPSTIEDLTKTSGSNSSTPADPKEKAKEKAIPSIGNEKVDSKSENITTPTSPISKNKQESAKDNSSKKSPEEKEDFQNDKQEIASDVPLSSGEQQVQSPSTAKNQTNSNSIKADDPKEKANEATKPNEKSDDKTDDKTSEKEIISNSPKGSISINPKESYDPPVASNPATREDCIRLLKYSFDGYDYNLNGNVAHEEVKEAWVMCHEEWKKEIDPERCELEARVFMKDIDVGGDNEVDFVEYVKYFQHLWRLSKGIEK